MKVIKKAVLVFMAILLVSAMLLCSCGEKAPQPDPSEIDPVDLPQNEEEELRYNVKEADLYGLYWYGNSILSYPDKAVQLSNAQVNGLLDKLSALEFTEENEGEGVLGGFPIICTIVTDDDKYCLSFNCGEITVWPSEEELFTLDGREHRKLYYFPDDPIFDYVENLNNDVKPEGVDPIS